MFSLKKEAEGKAGRLQRQLLKMDALILDELGSGISVLLALSKSGGPKKQNGLFRLIGKLYGSTSILFTTHLAFKE